MLVLILSLALGVQTRLRVAVAERGQPSAVALASPATLGAPAAPQNVPLDREGPMPTLRSAAAWINSPPLTPAALRGKVVLVDLWIYSCINCLRSLPTLEAWSHKYQDQGLVVIGVHSPEFAFERKLANVRQAVANLKVSFPVAVDNSLTIWRSFSNTSWPSDYLVDAQGEIRYHHFGEGGYAQTEGAIQELLAEAHHQPAPMGESLVHAIGTGAQAPAALNEIGSPETYFGYQRGERFDSSPQIQPDRTARYTAPPRPSLNQWGLDGDWNLRAGYAQLAKSPGGLVYRFHARDLHLVMGSSSGKPIRFKITIDGTAPGRDHGADTDAQGYGTVTAHQLYQLVRQQEGVENRTFEIQFLDPGVQVYAVAFG